MSQITTYDLTSSQLAVIKNTVAKDCNRDEFDLFMETSRSFGLDPFRKQIIPLIFSKDKPDKRRMSIVVSRDGLRVIAQRCQNYRPASEKAEWEFDESLIGPLNPKGIVSCTVYLWQQDNRGEWFRVKGEAEWDEFAPIADEWGENENGKWRPTGRKTLDASGNWVKMPKVMLEKCAEAQALRAGWPDQFSGVYVQEEMDRTAAIDASATEIVEREHEERRMRAIGAASAITVTWGDGWALDNVPVGEFADRAIEFIRENDAATVDKWQQANRVGLQQFWAKSPGDALEVKKEIEAKLAKAAA
ncbi:phage recombination protein Bet [Pelagibacterium flavum]|uniref:Phage recombination protein Bet n=1 Tax=Pelagibacterium flavum TaxID=2984530 RepID=A0ABY6IP47_9HYPH|nr:phage recombination protein Bet [Pelagibacterium sp. YIM 151497]UYQ71010.1 phage recombination protein Bet [Pelagibacterium sp. YIM 151497]